MELVSRCHDYVGHPEHQMFFKLDLKNGYWATLVYPDNPNYFAFSMPKMVQLQPTRMPQRSCSASFSFIELMYLVLGQIPATNEFPGMELILIQKLKEELPEGSEKFYWNHRNYSKLGEKFCGNKEAANNTDRKGGV